MDIDQQDLEVFTTSHWHSACWQKIAIHFLDRKFQVDQYLSGIKQKLFDWLIFKILYVAYFHWL